MRYWIGVVSRDHVQRGVAGGFCQLCHGKAAAMQRLTPGDWIVFYSRRTAMRAGEVL
jgi:EVE domain-containing protein